MTGLDTAVRGGSLVSDIFAGEHFFEARAKDREGFLTDDVDDGLTDDLVHGPMKPVGIVLIGPKVFEVAATSIDGRGGVIGDQVEVARRDGEIAFGFVQIGLRHFTSTGLLDYADTKLDSAVRVADGIDGEVDVDDASILANVASFEFVAVDFTDSELVGEVQLEDEVTRVRDVLKAESLEFVAGVAEKLAEFVIGAQVVAIR